MICESDSTTALSLITQLTDEFHPHAHLIHKIQSFSQRDWQVSFVHILREDNSCAVCLAKKGASEDHTLVIWDACPTQLDSSMLADAYGVVRLRS